MNTSHCNNNTNVTPATCEHHQQQHGGHYYGHELDYTLTVTIATYFIFIIVTGVTFNLLLVYTICSKRRLHTISNYLIVNLAVCDLVTAVSTLPFDSEFLLRGHYHHGDVLCALKETAFMFSLPSAIVNLLLLTAERFITIRFPFKQEKTLTKRNTAVVIVISWSYFLLVACFPLMYTRDAVVAQGGRCFIIFPMTYVYYQLFVNFSFPLLCILIMNCLIFRIASQHATCIRKQQGCLATRNSTNTTTTTPSTSKRQFLTNYKAAKTIMILVANVFLCWLTYISIVMLNVFCGCLTRGAVWVGNAANYTSIAVNPIAYGLMNRRIRNTILTRLYSSRFPMSRFSATDYPIRKPRTPSTTFDENQYIVMNDALTHSGLLQELNRTATNPHSNTLEICLPEYAKPRGGSML